MNINIENIKKIMWMSLHENILNLLIPYPANLIKLNFHPLEAVFRYRDPKLQVGEKYS